MIIEAPETTSALSALLPSVQSRLTHHAVLKLLLDQGKERLTPPQEKPDATLLKKIELLLKLKGFCVETFYQTDKESSLKYYWTGIDLSGNPVQMALDPKSAHVLLNFLLGGTGKITHKETPLSETEQNILSHFLKGLFIQFSFVKNTTPFTFTETAIQNPQISSFIIQTTTQKIGFSLLRPTPMEQNPVLFSEKIKKHLMAMPLTVSGKVIKQMNLRDLMNLKKGDKIPFAATETTLCVGNKPLIKSTFETHDYRNFIRIGGKNDL